MWIYICTVLRRVQGLYGTSYVCLLLLFTLLVRLSAALLSGGLPSSTPLRPISVPFCSGDPAHRCMHFLFYMMLSLQLTHSLLPSPQCPSRFHSLPSAILSAAPVRSKLVRPLWGAQAACHVPALLYILFHRYFAVMLCDLFH